MLLTGLLTTSAVLIEDVPGVGKTTLARAAARVCDLDFGRIQFTPDLLPGDITGMMVWNHHAREFHFRPGAVMHQFVLADEINRASARTQAALLEAMQEGSVTIDGQTHTLPQPFFLVATQNPLTFAGTFRLPEAQLDRFGLRVSIGYPSRADAVAISKMVDHEQRVARLSAVLSAAEIDSAREATRTVHVAQPILEFVVDIAEATRRTDLLRAGISPRACRHLVQTAQGRAFLAGRDYVLPEDVRECAAAVLAHRVVPSAEARTRDWSSERVMEHLLTQLPLPTGLQ